MRAPASSTVTKDGKTTDYAAKNIVLATGARARTMPGLEPDGKLIWTYREAMVPPSFPKSLLVVGSGAIGIEFASFYRTLGSEVTVVEILDRVLPVEDEEISQLAAKAFTKQGMKIRTATSVEKLEKGADNVTATLKAKDGKTETLTVDRVILAMGIVGNVENNGLRTGRASRSRRPMSSSTNGARPACRACGPSAISSVRPGSRTRRCMKA